MDTVGYVLEFMENYCANFFYFWLQSRQQRRDKRQDVTSCEHYELLINVNPNGSVLKILFDGANNNQRVNSSKNKACMEEFVDAAAMPM